MFSEGDTTSRQKLLKRGKPVWNVAEKEIEYSWRAGFYEENPFPMAVDAFRMFRIEYQCSNCATFSAALAPTSLLTELI